MLRKDLPSDPKNPEHYKNPRSSELVVEILHHLALLHVIVGPVYPGVEGRRHSEPSCPSWSAALRSSVGQGWKGHCADGGSHDGHDGSDASQRAQPWVALAAGGVQAGDVRHVLRDPLVAVVVPAGVGAGRLPCLVCVCVCDWGGKADSVRHFFPGDGWLSHQSSHGWWNALKDYNFWSFFFPFPGAPLLPKVQIASPFPPYYATEQKKKTPLRFTDFRRRSHLHSASEAASPPGGRATSAGGGPSTPTPRHSRRTADAPQGRGVPPPPARTAPPPYSGRRTAGWPPLKLWNTRPATLPFFTIPADNHGREKRKFCGSIFVQFFSKNLGVTWPHHKNPLPRGHPRRQQSHMSGEATAGPGHDDLGAEELHLVRIGAAGGLQEGGGRRVVGHGEVLRALPVVVDVDDAPAQRPGSRVGDLFGIPGGRTRLHPRSSCIP